VRRRDADDERVVRVALTAAGRDVHAEVVAAGCLVPAFVDSGRGLGELLEQLAAITANMRAVAADLRTAPDRWRARLSTSTKGTPMETLYTAEALATGGGRNGHVRTTDGILDFDVRVPKEMGGAGGAEPRAAVRRRVRRLLPQRAAGVARAQKVSIEGSSVGSRVGIGPNGQGGFQLAVELEVNIPEIDLAVAQQLADAAHQVCPYSNATRGNIEVTVTVVDD
jgi:Ohr subfamily peroxiredoxin